MNVQPTRMRFMMDEESAFVAGLIFTCSITKTGGRKSPRFVRQSGYATIIQEDNITSEEVQVG